jgi:choline dehydrogenase-like flavoprotein
MGTCFTPRRQEAPRKPDDDPRNGTDENEEDALVFDYVIVGAGPSAMGLLYGLLSTYYGSDDNDDDCDTTTTTTPTSCSSSPGSNESSSPRRRRRQRRLPMISIAVIERGLVGPAFLDNTPSSAASKNKNSRPPTRHPRSEQQRTTATTLSSTVSSSSFDHPNYNIKTTNASASIVAQQDDTDEIEIVNDIRSSPSTWYNAAHDKQQQQHQQPHSPHSVTAYHYPMELAGRRTFELPIGLGIGGTSNINACLSMEPMVQQDFQQWPEPWKSHLGQEWIPKIQTLAYDNGHLYYYRQGIASSIPYHYHYSSSSSNWDKTNDKKPTDKNNSFSMEHPEPYWLQIDPRGTPTLLQEVVVEEASLSSSSSSSSSSSRQSTSKQRHLVRSNYYKAILEPFLMKQAPSMETKQLHDSTNNASLSPPPLSSLPPPVLPSSSSSSSLSSSSLAAQSITWFHGVHVQRLLLQVSSSSSSSSFSTTSSSTSTAVQRVVSGVEGLQWYDPPKMKNMVNQDKKKRVYLQFHARQEVILCAGAIETPALLLVDQYETTTTTTQDGCTSQTTQRPPPPPFDPEEKQIRVLSGVGQNLRDQVLLPRAYLAPPVVWGARTKAKLSPNGMAFMGHLFTTTSTTTTTTTTTLTNVPGASTTNATTASSSREDEDGVATTLQGGTYTMDRPIFQVAVTDATGQVSTIPPLVSLAMFQRPMVFGSSSSSSSAGGWSRSTDLNTNTVSNDDGNQSTIAQRVIQSLTTACYIATKAVLKCLLQYTPIGWFLQHCTTTTLLMLMHPHSRGSIQIVPKRRPSSLTTTIGSDQPAKEEEKEEPPWRRHDFELDINVGYLKDPRDLDALKHAWNACAQLVRPSFGTVFPPKWLDNQQGSWWWKWYCSSVSLPYYHFSGTCAMRTTPNENDKDDKQEYGTTTSSNSKDWVVDSNLRVRTYVGLRICDASVFPTTISSPPALTLVAMGFGLGQQLANDLKLKIVGNQ